MTAETIVVILGRERRKGDKSSSSATPFPIKYWPTCQQEWRYQPNKPSATASKYRWNGDATSKHMGRSGEERDMLHKQTKPKTKSTHLNSKREVQKHFISLYRSVSTPEKPKHYQKQSKLQAALKNTKEHEDTHTSTFWQPRYSTFSPGRKSNKLHATRAALSGFTARLKAKTFFKN